VTNAAGPPPQPPDQARGRLSPLPGEGAHRHRTRQSPSPARGGVGEGSAAQAASLTSRQPADPRARRRRWLGHPGDLWRIVAADFTVRTAYQMGKTPLLPLYAAALGASELLIGYVVSISTLTGMLLKPLFGLLSDRMGRRLWIFIGLCLFAGTPFLYRFVETPEDLFALRLIHGTATAVFGPVGLAYVAEMGSERRAERLGIFGMARSGGYFLAPTMAAVLLTWLPAEQVFTIIGFLSLAAFLPAAGLTARPAMPRTPFLANVAEAMAAVRASGAFWFAAGLEISVHAATYAIKAFLPVYALTVLGVDLVLVGLFFSVQEGAHLLARPWGGRLADRHGPERMIMCGLFLLAPALLVLGMADGLAALLAVAVTMGIALGLVLPATLSLLAAEMPAGNLGAGMGALGALRNLGKVCGPVAAGLVLSHSDYRTLFALCALLAILTAGAVGLRINRQRRTV